MTAEEVIAREPDLIIGSWCGKKFRPERVAARPGFTQIHAVQTTNFYEIKSSLILKPFGVALTDGLAKLQEIIQGMGDFESEEGELHAVGGGTLYGVAFACKN